MAFGLVCLPLTAFQWHALKALSWHDWRWAFALSVIGNFVYYGFLAFSIQTLGSPLPSLLIGTLPVVIAVCANLGIANTAHTAHSAGTVQPQRIAWRTLALPIGLLLTGLLCLNWEELQLMPTVISSNYWLGLLAALLAVATWTWYPLYNDRHLKRAEQQSKPIKSATWATALGLATLLPSAVLFVGLLMFASFGKPIEPVSELSLFDTLINNALGLPQHFWWLMFLLGFASSWLGTFCWNAACQRLPAAISGQLIVFETLAALAFGYAYRGQWPSMLSALGIAVLVAGVLLGGRCFTRIK